MMLIGVDPHKTTHTATAVEPQTNQEVASIRIDASLREYRRMLTWATTQWPGWTDGGPLRTPRDSAGI